MYVTWHYSTQNVFPVTKMLYTPENYSLQAQLEKYQAARKSRFRECNACFTLADPTPRLASDVFGGKSGQSHPTSHQDPIHIGRMAHNAYIRVGWYSERVLFITTPSKRQLHCTRSAPDRPMASGNIKHVLYWLMTFRWSPDEAPTADAASGTHSHWPS